MNESFVVLPLAVVLATVLIAAVTDFWKVLNFLTMPFLVSVVAYQVVVHGSSGLALSLVGAVFGFAVLLLFFLLGGTGGGDVKQEQVGSADARNADTRQRLIPFAMMVATGLMGLLLIYVLEH